MHLGGHACRFRFTALAIPFRYEIGAVFRFDKFLPRMRGGHVFVLLVFIARHTVIQMQPMLPTRHDMDPLTNAAASGIRSRIESLDLLANNIANASSPGFKADREFYSVYVSDAALDTSEGSSNAQLPVVQTQWTDFRQGSLTSTGNPLDLALNGDGFFVAKGPSGSIFTRDGSFQLSAQGQLQTLDGYLIEDQNGKPISVDMAKPITVDREGVVHQSGEDIAHMALVIFRDPSRLVKHGDNFFLSDSSMPPLPTARLEVKQGTIESSNSDPAQSAVRLVNIMRQFETLQKAMNIGAEMNRSAVQDVAKVTQ